MSSTFWELQFSDRYNPYLIQSSKSNQVQFPPFQSSPVQPSPVHSTPLHSTSSQSRHSSPQQSWSLQLSPVSVLSSPVQSRTSHHQHNSTQELTFVTSTTHIRTRKRGEGKGQRPIGSFLLFVFVACEEAGNGSVRRRWCTCPTG